MGNEGQKKLDVFFVLFFLLIVSCISVFNYIVDPYFVFRDSAIKGFNNVKTYKYANKRTILYSDLKFNNRKIDTAFVGNCLISRFGANKNNIAFYIIPVATVSEVTEIIKNINVVAPHIKTIYWGLMLQDLWYEKSDEVMDTLPELDSKNITLNDFINLFFSWNTTKFSILTVRDSIKNKGEEIIYVYPYKEIALKKYTNQSNLDITDDIKNIIEEAAKNGIEIIVYHSPIHISKRIHLYEKGLWEKNMEFKNRLAQITSFYDFSLPNEYNNQPLDENSEYYIDNIHPTNVLNNIVINDLIKRRETACVKITKDNVNEYNKKDTIQLKEYINSHKNEAEKINNLKESDAKIKIKKLHNNKQKDQ